MQGATLGIALVGVVLSALSLSWQATTFILTGGRVKAELRMGATDGRKVVTLPAAEVHKPGQLECLRTQGFKDWSWLCRCGTSGACR